MDYFKKKYGCEIYFILNSYKSIVLYYKTKIWGPSSIVVMIKTFFFLFYFLLYFGSYYEGEVI